ncbi:hypothetical protein A3742_03505 [Oleiphilus sp. HI0071]|uniref:DUF4345 domain-containing protein n=1 Tax=unclassified Oleiphilus TaxID=2631174 RepID=UPI0007C395EE|nr:MULTISPECIES: DUF4345 domain-containing protein [unclassified Oleiphilus]KZY60972.1 hypothetical protein A3737_15500 [Oleiphilus sp. HI0065]KZY88587.1 hypothetical protein A3742_03505 [Oleiphilus sp. HI0071]KZY97892.1 hypothetical protein A3744_01580 [Oleiphilus sp. HI0073]KZZ44430.1 hypothetical protein A3758_18480 [Oleiphilus sp. HI0118]KZZ61836.1 hypothetical protein A3760_00055 [Oleiphilus sp. HI0122]KZZ66412.1 hypothetical protein A3765_05245 [Oleiphilus sp. HI0130]KZZ78987.1 hypothe
MSPQSIFLIVAVIGLTPIALSYGYAPATSLDFLFGIDAGSVNVTHIFRAVMGLYMALALFWAAGALNQKYRLPALYSLVVFMIGLAAGRALSLLLDGMPHWLLFVYLLLELGFGLVGIKMIHKEQSETA